MDVSTRIALITGATIGIGREIAAALAANGHALVLQGRSPDRLRDATRWLHERYPRTHIETLRADLQVLAEVRGAARELASRVPRLDTLVLNAEIVSRDPHLTVDGWESTFAVNHLAHFALAQDLLPLLRASAAHHQGHPEAVPRVVITTNAAHARGRFDPHRMQSLEGFDAYRSYADSKLANLLFMAELQRRWPGMAVNAHHPGHVPQKLLTHQFGAEGGDTIIGRSTTAVWLASAPESARLRGTYCVDSHPAHPSTAAQDPELAATLWELSEKALG